jgi:Uma2 family endonuclease
LDGTGCIGAPDMVIEITSPSTARRDKTLKFDLYLSAGVREYWIVDPDSKSVSIHVLKDGEYTAAAYADTDTVGVHILNGCTIDLPEVFAE